MPLHYKLLAALFVLLAAGGAISMFTSVRDHDASLDPAPGRVWSEEHQHWH